VHSEWGYLVEQEHPGRKPEAVVLGWGSQERNAEGTGGVSARKDTALTRGKKHSHFLQR
jgi:hypothetical protein